MLAHRNAHPRCVCGRARWKTEIKNKRWKCRNCARIEIGDSVFIGDASVFIGGATLGKAKDVSMRVSWDEQS